MLGKASVSHPEYSKYERQILQSHPSPRRIAMHDCTRNRPLRTHFPTFSIFHSCITPEHLRSIQFPATKLIPTPAKVFLKRLPELMLRLSSRKCQRTDRRRVLERSIFLICSIVVRRIGSCAAPHRVVVHGTSCITFRFRAINHHDRCALGP